MKIVNIIGGLGNQMFQYAFALALQLRFPNEEIKIDISSFGLYNLHNGFEFEKVFDLSFPIATKEEVKRLAYYSENYKLNRIMKHFFPRRKKTCYEFPLSKFNRRDLYREGDRYYEGYWQNYQYFHLYRADILKAFQFKEPLPDSVKKIVKNICDTNSVCIHIRRGDYLLHKNYRGCCELDYYKKAIEYVYKTMESPTFFIFSNDIDWCKKNIINLLNKDFFIIDCNRGEDSYRDMQLMSYGKTLIIANSSFSWWSAYLNQNENLMVIAPAIWSNNRKTYDRQLDSWIRL